MKIKQGDVVEVISGSYTGKQGRVLKVISVKATKVPWEPQINLLRSYPVTFFTTLPPDFIISPFPLTPLKPRTWSLTLPALNRLGPEILHATCPAAVPKLLFHQIDIQNR